MNIDFDCLNSRFDNQLICKFDNLFVDSFDETVVEKIDFDKHCSYNETEKIEKIDVEIEMIVVEIAINDCYCYTSLLVNFFKKIPCKASELDLNLIKLRKSISRNCSAISAISHFNNICTRQIKHTNENSF